MSRARRLLPALGLLPFLAYVVVFMVIPTINVAIGAVRCVVRWRFDHFAVNRLHRTWRRAGTIRFRPLGPAGRLKAMERRFDHRGTVMRLLAGNEPAAARIMIIGDVWLAVEIESGVSVLIDRERITTTRGEDQQREDEQH